MSLKYFGTDGIRGEVEGDRVNESFFKKVGCGIGCYLRDKKGGDRIKVIIGRDTRESGKLLEKAMLKGLSCVDGEAFLLGVVPTPGVSFCVKDLKADMGIMITASHNPSTDNGVKFLDAEGKKLTVDKEMMIESAIDSYKEVVEDSSFATKIYTEGINGYLEFMQSILRENILDGWKVVLDLANGAAYKTTRQLFEFLGAEVILLGVSPDGKNINEGVGSEHSGVLAQKVQAEEACIGIAHDGDGDRLVVCDEIGNVVAGDQLLFILALHALREGQLNKDTAVVTIQSNVGLDMALNKVGVEVVRVDVGDRNVLNRMEELGCNFGGESSGHIIFSDYIKTGDALLAALKLVEVLLVTGMSLAELRSEISLLPQITKNIRVKEKLLIKGLVKVNEVIADYEKELNGEGRVLVRYSGTEPKIRLMIEGKYIKKLEKGMDALKEAVKEDLEVIG